MTTEGTATLEERTSRNEAQIEEIRTHFATKADLYRVALTIVLAQAGFTTAVVSVAVGVLLRFG